MTRLWLAEMRVGLARLVAGWVLVAGAACSDKEPISAPGTRTALPAVVIHEAAGPDDELRSGLDAYRLEIGP